MDESKVTYVDMAKPFSEVFRLEDIEESLRSGSTDSQQSRITLKASNNKIITQATYYENIFTFDFLFHSLIHSIEDCLTDYNLSYM